MGNVVLVTGGARSGKSRYAEQRVACFSAPWIYVATAQAGDEEMAQRIRQHRARRSAQWCTVEEPLDLVGALKESEDSCGARLVDCLTLWLSNLMGAEKDLAEEIDRLAAYLHGARTPTVLVSNEVGLGIVPNHPQAREFRDHAGRMNQTIAGLATEVILMVSGLPLHLKPKGSAQ